MPLLDVPLLARLQEEFRLSMKRLLCDLCLDLESQYADVAKSLTLPVAYFRFLGQALERDAYAHWKVVGWIEALNDLVYFIDLLQQIREEKTPRQFAAQLFAECQEKFFENSYLDDLFPRGVSQASGLERRLNELCMRLTQDLTQESLCLVPGLPILWCVSRKIPSWSVEVHLGHNVERADMLGTLAAARPGAPSGCICVALAARDGHRGAQRQRLSRGGGESSAQLSQRRRAPGCGELAVRWLDAGTAHDPGRGTQEHDHLARIRRFSGGDDGLAYTGKAR